MSATSQWLSLFLIAVSFVFLLFGIVITLRRVGDHVGTPVALTGASGQVSGTTMRHTLAVTLLPFLWIYATFGRIQEVARQVVLEGS